MNKKRLSRLLAALVCASLVAAAGVYAFFNKTDVNMDNEFTVAEPKVYLSEKFDPTDKWVPGEIKEKEVKFGNTGTMDCYLRAKFTPKLELSDGTEVTDSDILADFKLNFASDFATNWTVGSDGWYYYNELLPAGAKTPVALESVTISDAISNDVHGIKTDFSGAKFTVDIKGEFVQSEKASDAAAENGWGVDPTTL